MQTDVFKKILLVGSISNQMLRVWFNRIELFISGLEREKPNKFCSRHAGREREYLKSLPAIRDGNGNYQKGFPLFGTGTGNPKNSSRCLETGIQGAPVEKYTGTGIPAYAWTTVGFILKFNRWIKSKQYDLLHIKDIFKTNVENLRNYT